MTKELLEKLKNAKTDEERKQIVEDNKAVLSDDELDKVSGGMLTGTFCSPYEAVEGYLKIEPHM